ncbi:MAG: hypothetical protein ISR65_19645 [Bacteriovoracaceae bacterium]|nr:hypothetical protein [Bacteriovoracaceae bacterium]
MSKANYNSSGSSENTKKTVVVGMTGGLDSTVAAYLLKTQKYHCIGVAIKYTGGDEAPENEKDIVCDCNVDQLDFIQKICEHLDIPFYAVEASDLFKYRVIDHALAATIGGLAYYPCANCTELTIDILCDKAKKLGANYIATGHYSKIAYNKKTNLYNLITANDPIQDQSFDLSCLGQSHLQKMILPLAELRRVEVSKIADSLGFNFKLRKKSPGKRCLSYSNAFIEFVEKSTPKSLRLMGGIINYEDQYFITEHDGIHRYHIGQKNLESDGPVDIDPHLEIVKIIPSVKNIYVAVTDKWTFSFCILSQFLNISSLDVSKPHSAYVKFGVNELPIACIVNYKSNQHVSLEFLDPVKGHIARGTYVALYDSVAKGAKVVGCGVLQRCGDFDNIYNEEFPKDKKQLDYTEDDSDDNQNQEVNKDEPKF